MKIVCEKCGYQFETEEKERSRLLCSYCGEKNKLGKVKGAQEILED